MCFSMELMMLQEIVSPFIVSITQHSVLLLVFSSALAYVIYRRKVNVYLLDFSCYKPPRFSRLPMSTFIENNLLDNASPESVAFQAKILEKSGYSEETCLPQSLTCIPRERCLVHAIEEAEAIMYTTIGDLLQKNNMKPRNIDILITNDSLFCPTPSLSAMIVNKFRLRSNILSFNLSGMGCSAGIISVGLAKDLLTVHSNSLALIVSTEILNLNWYNGRVRSMLLTNCLFRMGGAAILLSNKIEDKNKAKYELQHVVRTTTARDDPFHACVFQDVDPENKEGISISKSILNVAGDALKRNISSLGLVVLPLSEQLCYVFSILCHKLWTRRRAIYTPKFNEAFEHFCIHAGGRAVIEGIEKNLRLRKLDVEASRMTLYRFGNTSSSSIWYELCYTEAKGRMKYGHRVWQIAFGSGFKCNSAVWKCRQDVVPNISNAWSDVIHSYPKHIPDVIQINM